MMEAVADHGQGHWISPASNMLGPEDMAGGPPPAASDMFFHPAMDSNANHMNPASYYNPARTMHSYRSPHSKYILHMYNFNIDFTNPSGYTGLV